MNRQISTEELNRELTIRNINTAMELHLITSEQAIDAFLTVQRQEGGGTMPNTGDAPMRRPYQTQERPAKGFDQVELIDRQREGLGISVIYRRADGAEWTGMVSPQELRKNRTHVLHVACKAAIAALHAFDEKRRHAHE